MKLVKKSIPVTKANCLVLNGEETVKKEISVVGEYSTQKGFKKAYAGDEIILYILGDFTTEISVYSMSLDKFLENATIYKETDSVKEKQEESQLEESDKKSGKEKSDKKTGK